MKSRRTFTLYIRTDDVADLPEPLWEIMEQAGDTLAQGRLHTDDRTLDVAVSVCDNFRSEDYVLGVVLSALGTGFLKRAKEAASDA